jgi:hypothetical protein
MWKKRVVAVRVKDYTIILSSQLSPLKREEIRSAKRSREQP